MPWKHLENLKYFNSFIKDDDIPIPDQHNITTTTFDQFVLFLCDSKSHHLTEDELALLDHYFDIPKARDCALHFVKGNMRKIIEIVAHNPIEWKFAKDEFLKLVAQFFLDPTLDIKTILMQVLFGPVILKEIKTSWTAIKDERKERAAIFYPLLKRNARLDNTPFRTWERHALQCQADSGRKRNFYMRCLPDVIYDRRRDQWDLKARHSLPDDDPNLSLEKILELVDMTNHAHSYKLVSGQGETRIYKTCQDLPPHYISMIERVWDITL